MNTLGLDPEIETPGRQVVRHTGGSLVKAMEMALESGEPEAAQLVAAEAIVLAESKDHLNWQLIGEAANKTKGKVAEALTTAHEEVEDEEDEHLYHTTGWCARALDRISGHGSGVAATRRSQRSKDGHRRRARSTRPHGYVVRSESCDSGRLIFSDLQPSTSKASDSG